MSVRISFNKTQLLYCDNDLFGEFYDTLLDIIEDGHFKLSPKLVTLIDNLEMGEIGISQNLAEVITNKADLVMFATLIAKVYEKWMDEYPEIPEENKDTIWDFHNELLKCADTLKK